MSVRKMRILETSINFTAQSYDIDTFGVVSNIVYVRWLEDLRMALTQALCPVINLLEQNFTSVIAETYIQYKNPMRFQDKALGTVWIEDATRAKWKIGAELIEISSGQPVCTATQIGVFYNYSDKQIMQVPSLLQAFVNDMKRKNNGT